MAIELHYAGRAIEISSSGSGVRDIRELLQMSLATERRLASVFLGQRNGYGVFVVGGGIQVAVTGLIEEQVPMNAAPSPSAD